uniref:Methyltransferase type 11 domain-containing protein n=1 Tax=Acrobeloides nanus TaxID=290746 RepID=A0A914C8I4_9BILA
MDHAPDLALKVTFDKEAELYNEVRSGYPDLLFDKLIQVTNLTKESSLLEIGPRPGKATKSLAQRGFRITGIELGAQLATLARKVLQDYPNVNIINSSFEDIDLPPHSYDLIYAAAAFHWIQPNVQYTKTHLLLKPGGYLAIWGESRISDENADRFFYALKELADKYDLFDGHPLPKKLSELEPSDNYDKNLFEVAYFEAFPKTVKLSTEDFVKLIGTYSKYIALDAETKEIFTKELRKMIHDEFGGVVERSCGNILTVLKAK